MSPAVRLPPEVDEVRGHNQGSIIFRARERRHFAAVTFPHGRVERQVPWSLNCPKHRPAANPKCPDCLEAANEVLRQLLEERDAELVPARRLTLASYLRSWIADMDARPATIVSYRGVIENHIIPALGSTPLSRLGPSAIQHWLDGMAASARLQPPLEPDKPGTSHAQSRGASPASIAHRRAVLRAALNLAVRRRYIVRSPLDGTEPVSIPKHRATVLSAEQAGSLIEGTAGDWYGPLWAVLLGSGLRISEALALTWDGFDGSSITVRYQLARRDGQWVRVPTKAARSVERVALPSFASAALVTLNERSGKPKFGHCFLTPGGTPPSEQQCLQALYAAEKRLGLPRVTLHQLRHSHLTILAEAGVPEDVRMRRAGHGTVAMGRYYVHGAEAADRAAADELNRAIGGEK
jgi:integrase